MIQISEAEAQIRCNSCQCWTYKAKKIAPDHAGTLLLCPACFNELGEHITGVRLPTVGANERQDLSRDTWVRFGTHRFKLEDVARWRHGDASGPGWASVKKTTVFFHSGGERIELFNELAVEVAEVLDGFAGFLPDEDD